MNFAARMSTREFPNAMLIEHFKLRLDHCKMYLPATNIQAEILGKVNKLIKCDQDKP
jgi:hypothetical protein